MTRTTRLAGFTFLFHIAVAFPSMVLFNRATSGAGLAAKLAGIAQHATDLRLAAVLSLGGCFCALVLAAWLQQFRFGPPEWVWRTLTYARPQPLRRAT